MSPREATVRVPGPIWVLRGVLLWSPPPTPSSSPTCLSFDLHETEWCPHLKHHKASKNVKPWKIRKVQTGLYLLNYNLPSAATGDWFQDPLWTPKSEDAQVLMSGIHIHSSASTDSANHGWCSTVYTLKKVHVQTDIFQTCVVQGLVVLCCLYLHVIIPTV